QPPVRRGRAAVGRGGFVLLARRRRGLDRVVGDALPAPMTRRRLVRPAALAGAVAALVASSAALTRAQAAPVASARQQLTAVEAGRNLFVTGCSRCHGLDGRGTRRGPDKGNAGAAASELCI